MLSRLAPAERDAASWSRKRDGACHRHGSRAGCDPGSSSPQGVMGFGAFVTSFHILSNDISVADVISMDLERFPDFLLHIWKRRILKGNAFQCHCL